jgi:hypothetical protein
MNSFEILIEQIDAFIRKYYKNQMLKGVLLFLVVLLTSFLITTSVEFYVRFASWFRAFLFFSFIGLNAVIFLYYFILPLFKLYSFGRRINRHQAAEIIGAFFPEISDRLKNTLQLHKNLEMNEGNIELLRASVSQRSEKFSKFSFSKAVDYGSNRRYAKYLIPLFVIFIAIGIAAPSLFLIGGERVLNYNKEYKDPPPFSYALKTKNLSIEEGNDLPVEVEINGDELPDLVYMISDNGKVLMEKVSRNYFKGVIKKPKQSGNFYFEANEVTSSKFGITVFGKSVLGKFEANIHYPKYLGKTDEIIQNAGDLTLPEGTEIEWNISTKNTKYTDVSINDKQTRYTNEGFRISKKAISPLAIKMNMHNKYQDKIDSSKVYIDVIKDAYPDVFVQEKCDSAGDGLRFFNGRVSDDYGLNSLIFVYTIVGEDGSKKQNKMSVRSVSGFDVPFDFAVDFRREDVKLNDKIEYYFVVSDNDGVNGSKSTKSQTFTYQLPSLQELNEKREDEQEQVKADLSELLQKTDEFQKKVDKLKKEALNSKSTDWNKLNKVNQLKEEQQQIINNLEQLQDQMQLSKDEKNQLSEIDPSILEKQEMIEKLLQELMDDELRNLLDELEKLMQENNREEMQEKLDDIDQSSDDLKKQLDRSLEMLKRLQVNEKMDDIENELKELAEEQEALKDQVENKSLSNDAAKEKQNEINEKFEELKDDVEKLKELNQELEQPMDLDNMDESEQEISDELNSAEENLSNQKSGKAAQNQKSAADGMKKMASDMDAAQQAANQQQQEEDINALRMILESLMTLSFDQEDLISSFNRISDSDPAYRKYGRKQRKIIDDTKIVKDSLLALAKRQPKIATFIDAELASIEDNLSLSVEDIDEHMKRELQVHQQLVMTSYNNLALLLNESLQSMQQQMQSMQQGSGSCNNPGGKGKPKPGSSMTPGDMKEMLQKQLEQLQKGQGKEGKSPGDGKGQGKEGQNMLGLSNEQIAKMAAEQTAIRQRLEELKQELNKDGQGQGNALNELLKELEKQESDLINKSFNNEMLTRQKNILTRLLESEKALLERGYEEKRESNSGKNLQDGNKIRFDEYNKEKLKQIELLKTIDPVYKKYYKDKANEYFNSSF